jgi:SPP1 family phage portal protein
MSPETSFMVYDDSIVESPLFFVRRWSDRENKEFGCCYSAVGYRNFAATGGLRWTDEDWQPHFYKGVPATEFMQNEERIGVYEPILSMSNAYNKAVSEKANDVDYFSDAYLKILGVTLDEEGMKHIRDNRIINFEGEDAQKLIVEFMGKPEGDTTQENLLDRLERLIYQISMVANISDENFGTSSGIAMKYKLQAMSNLAKTKQRKFTSGMNRRYKLLFGHPASKVPAEAWMQLEYQFTPNIPANMLEEAQMAAQLEGIVSHETQLKVLSMVDNVEAELEKIEEENKAAEESIVDQMMFGTVAKNATTETEVMDDETT